ncbi:hypothetical protein, partial [Staphylococcus epidermidis]|uniref:hypothetical protein n=1 Tax=Staphylococcus epidermidis TaxID=1282 RepID=UPI001C930515
TAQPLNHPINHLTNTIQNQSSLRQHTKYINPTHPKKHQYNHPLTQLQNIINQQHPTFHKQIINQLTDPLNQPNNHLNPLQLLHAHK